MSAGPGLVMVVTGAADLVAKLAAVPTAAQAAFGRGLNSAGLIMERYAREHVYDGHPTGHLEGDRGQFRRSITHDVDRGALVAHIGTNIVYGPIHEYGGDIKPQGHPFLAIPLDKRLRGISPRDVPGLHYVQSLKGQPLLVDDAGEPQYLLRAVVHIPARPIFGPTMRATGEQASNAVIAEVVKVIEP